MSTQNNATENWNITAGPSRDDLANSLIHACKNDTNGNPPFKVRFTITSEDGKNQDVALWARITGLEHEDGSGQSFIFRGCGTDRAQGNGTYDLRLHGYYHTNRRAGWLKLEDMDHSDPATKPRYAQTFLAELAAE